MSADTSVEKSGLILNCVIGGVILLITSVGFFIREKTHFTGAGFIAISVDT